MFVPQTIYCNGCGSAYKSMFCGDRVALAGARVCSQECRDKIELAYARCILSKPGPADAVEAAPTETQGVQL